MKHEVVLIDPMRLLHDTSDKKVREAVFDPALNEEDRTLLFSVQQHGIIEPLKVIQSSMVCKDGNRRLDAARWLHLDKVPVQYLSDEEDQAQRQTVAVAVIKKNVAPEELGRLLIAELSETVDQQALARKYGISTATVSRAVRAARGLSNGRKKELESASAKVGSASARVTYEDVAEARSAINKLLRELS